MLFGEGVRIGWSIEREGSRKRDGSKVERRGFGETGK